jgi:DNA-binding response OmpR family regulator
MTIKKNDKQRILIVDDESDITSALKMYLELQGFQVHAFTDPGNALAQFKGMLQFRWLGQIIIFLSTQYRNE